MPRMSRDQMFIGIAEVAAQRSTCYRGNTGAVIVDSRHSVLAIGYNGPPSGEPHCLGNDCQHDQIRGCHRSIHAEINAIKRCSISKFFPYTIYTTSSPCFNCAQEIIGAIGIKRVVYRYPYRDLSPINRLLQHDIRVHRLTPSGFCIDEAGGNILEGI